MTSAVEEYLLCLKEDRFYDAHEALEAVWFPRRFEESDDVLLLKGLINASVSFELIKRGRPGPSAKVWQNYLKYLPKLEGVEEHRDQFERMINAVESTKQRLMP